MTRDPSSYELHFLLETLDILTGLGIEDNYFFL